MVNRARVRPLNQARPGQGPVVYWMSRDQRVRDNWALLYAQELALSMGQPLGVVFCLAPAFLGASLRQYGFMLKGLQEVAGDLADLNLPFFLLTGEPARELPGWVSHYRVGTVVCDFSPLRRCGDGKPRWRRGSRFLSRKWTDTTSCRVGWPPPRRNTAPTP